MPFSGYLAQLRATLKSGQATEPSYYPALKNLLEALESGVAVTQNPKKTEHGSPDFSVKRKKHVHAFPVGWIEAKDIGEDLNKIERSDQLKRYLHLPNLVLTDFLEFRWYTGGQRRLTARLARLDDAKLSPDSKGEVAVRDLILGFLAHSIPPTRNSRELARVMARLAHFIRDATLYAFEREPEGGKLHNQLQAFRDTLIPDLKPDQFADMYAQTIAYGLFAAACQPRPATEAFTRATAADLIPRTNPFLRKLFQEIAGVDLPEPLRPFVDDLVALLRESDLNSILADFGKRAGKEDPVVHFYEDFLHAYDPREKKIRGVYYTPEPVVSYIVRSIDHLLKTRFNKPDGLADPNVLILDPACGTGTFLYFVIRHIYDHLCAKGQQGAWNSYVSQNLLKRVFGFELLMAPYAVAHLKLGLLLQELGYSFDTDERLGIYLTNTLEEAIKRSEVMFAQWIADEANAASEIKRDKPIMVVLGNPPYSVSSLNRGPWITKLIGDYKKGLKEKKLNIDDDYIKFIRFGQWRIEKTGHGILGFVSNNSYLDGPTYRAMRKSLMDSHSHIHVLNLHGSSKRKEKAPDGGADENVFDIQQGVAISLFLKLREEVQPRVHRADLWGMREGKYGVLLNSDVSQMKSREVSPQPPMYFFFAEPKALKDEFESAVPITKLFEVFGSGFNTDRDGLCIDFEEETLKKRMQAFFSGDYDEVFRTKFDLRPTSSYDPERRRTENTFEQDSIRSCVYRPFDLRSVYYQPGFTSRPVFEVMKHMLRDNIGLVAARQSKEPFGVLAIKYICTHKIVTVYDRSSLFPLYLHPQSSDKNSLSFVHQRQESQPNF